MFSGADECFEQNTDYAQEGNLLQQTGGKSAEYCQKLCQNMWNCEFFTWENLAHKLCQLRRNDGGKTTSYGRTSGPKFCYGMIYSCVMNPTQYLLNLFNYKITLR